MLTKSSICAVILLSMIAVSCERGAPNPTGGSAADSDGDGLADVDETKLYHTSPATKDTDGDGYDDYQEIRELGYDPSNPTKFNPLVADTPCIKIELITVPEVEVTYTRSKGETQTKETGDTVTTGRSLMTSRSEEASFSLSVGASSGLSGGVSVTGTAGISVNLTEQETNEYQRALSRMRSNSQIAELHEEGGLIRVLAAISNAGHIPFTLQNLTLTAARREGNKTRPITQLEAETARPFFDMGTWAPGEREEFLFVGRNLLLSDVEKILTSNLIVQVGKYELKDANGQSFGHRTGAIDAACARVVIDQGGGLPAESYMVSTRAAPDERGLPLNAILDTLGMPYETGKVAWTYRKLSQQGRLAIGAGALETGQTRNGLLRLGEVPADPQGGGRWVIIHETPAGASRPVTQRYDLLEADYRLEDIRLKARQAVLLTYVRDPDRDGLATSEENTLGTDPREADTDGDGIADGDEQAAGTDPLRNNNLPRPRIASMKSENLGQQVTLSIDLTNPEETERLHVQWGDGSLPEEIKEPRRTLTFAHRYESVGKYKIVATPYAGPRSPGEPYEILVSTAPALTRKLTVEFGTSGADRLHQIAVDREGNVYLAGDVENMTPLKGLAPGRVFLAKCDRSGEQEWVEQFGATYQMPGGLAADREGNVHLATFDNRSEPKQPASLRMYTPKGERVRDVTIRDERPLRDLDLTSNGGYYFAAERWRNDATPALAEMAEREGGPGARDRFLRLAYGQSLKIPRRDGSIIWLLNSRRPDVHRMLAGPGRPGRIAGEVSFSLTVSGPGAGPSKTWTAYLPSDVSVQAMAVDASDGLYACGYRRVGAFTARASSNDSSFVARYSPKGELSWMRFHGNDERDQSVAIAVDGRGNAYVVDLAAGRTPDKPNRGLFDVRLVKYDPSGKVLWMRQFGTPLFDVAFSVAVWPPIVPGTEPRDAETVYLAGITQGDLSDETKEPKSPAKLNAFLVAYDRHGTRRFLEQFPLGAALPDKILNLRLSTWAQFEEALKRMARDPEEARRSIVIREAGLEESEDLSRTWWRQFPVSAHVAVDEKGNVYLAGSSEKSLDGNYQNKGSADIFLVRYAPNQEGER